MRSPILPIRQAGRICDACRQQHLICSRSRSRSFASPARALLANSNSSSPTMFAPRQAPDRTIPRTRQFFSTSAGVLQSSSPQPSSTSSPSTSNAEGEAIDANANANHNNNNHNDRPKAAAPRSHYDFFPRTLPLGPPPAGPFAIDTRALRREFLALQGGAHPDLHPAHLKARAEAASARINEAYRTLESPLARAQHLLALRGLGEDERGRVEDPELLALVLEARERIEDAREEEDLEGPRRENEERVRKSEDLLARMFAEDDLAGAAAEVVRLRYWVNIRESIRNWERGRPVVLEH
ncbi:Co-chaperone Hsc20 [Biscogniauxia marginata]|nr:Co-chaperone Hsc20 [Biscogniauxia marginata]